MKENVMRILLPATGPEDWRRFLADPEKQWREGYSAYDLAHRWHQKKPKKTNGLPKEIRDLFKTSPCATLRVVKPLLVMPEYRVSLPARGRGSQNDIFLLAKASDEALVSVMVEGKTKESFDEIVGHWKASTTDWQKRFQYICDHLGLSKDRDELDSIHYQLLHRTASAVIEARTYNAAYAVMIVHSFSAKDDHWAAFDAFVRLYDKTPQIGQLVELKTVELQTCKKVRLFAGWARADMNGF